MKWTYLGFRVYVGILPPIMENHMEKKMENKMETECIYSSILRSQVWATCMTASSWGPQMHIHTSMDIHKSIYMYNISLSTIM